MRYPAAFFGGAHVRTIAQRRGMCCLLMLGLAGAAGAQPPAAITPHELNEGWILLFDGATLFGWQAVPAGAWQVSESALHAAPAEKAFLRSTSQFGDFALKLRYLAGPQTDAAVVARLASQSLPPDPSKCYMVRLGTPDRPPEGSLLGRKEARALPARAGWRTLELCFQGGRVGVALDGQQVLDYADPQPVRRGHVAIVCSKGSLKVAEIKLKPLGMKNLFNGKDLSGWKTYPELKTIATVTPEGWLRLQNGKGQLETEGQWSDFTLQLEVFVNGQGLNSGVFFRSIPGEIWNGYESQIHNGYRDGDRTKPVDCGTGGIFRRQNARRVVPDDRQWFWKTIHADGPHMAVWVNGYQVSDWTDTRPPDENPRRGRRLKAGTIILQGHDPKTDLFFRNIRIAELPLP